VAEQESGSLRIEALSRGSIGFMRLSGAIDETFNVTDLQAASACKDVIIDTKAVYRISSFGVREWVNGMNKLAQAKNRIVLVECSPVIVRQLNMVANFASHCDIVSVQAPYFCSACNWETEITIPIEAAGPNMPVSPPPCPRCKKPMDLDEEPGFYFHFAQPNRFRPLDAHLADFIASLEREKAPEPKLRIFSAQARRASQLGMYVWQEATKRLGRRGLAAVAGAIALIVVVAGLALSLSHRPPPVAEPTVAAADLQQYHQLLSTGDFAAADQLIASLQARGAFPATLADAMRADVAAKRKEATAKALTDGQRLFARRRFDEALNKFQVVETLSGADIDTQFAIAECFRRLGKRPQADERYAQFLDALGAGGKDSRVDDAMFWRADFLLSQGKKAEAVPMLEKLAAKPKGIYRRSAQRLLKTAKAL